MHSTDTGKAGEFNGGWASVAEAGQGNDEAQGGCASRQAATRPGVRLAGAGVITLGVGAAMASGAGIAHADDTGSDTSSSPSSSSSDSSSSSSAGSTSTGADGRRPSPPRPPAAPVQPMTRSRQRITQPAIEPRAQHRRGRCRRQRVPNSLDRPRLGSPARPSPPHTRRRQMLWRVPVRPAPTGTSPTHHDRCEYGHCRDADKTPVKPPRRRRCQRTTLRYRRSPRSLRRRWRQACWPRPTRLAHCALPHWASWLRRRSAGSRNSQSLPSRPHPPRARRGPDQTLATESVAVPITRSRHPR